MSFNQLFLLQKKIRQLNFDASALQNLEDQINEVSSKVSSQVNFVTKKHVEDLATSSSISGFSKYNDYLIPAVDAVTTLNGKSPLGKDSINEITPINHNRLNISSQSGEVSLKSSITSETFYMTGFNFSEDNVVGNKRKFSISANSELPSDYASQTTASKLLDELYNPSVEGATEVSEEQAFKDNQYCPNYVYDEVGNMWGFVYRGERNIGGVVHPSGLFFFKKCFNNVNNIKLTRLDIAAWFQSIFLTDAILPQDIPKILSTINIQKKEEFWTKTKAVYSKSQNVVWFNMVFNYLYSSVGKKKMRKDGMFLFCFDVDKANDLGLNPTEDDLKDLIKMVNLNDKSTPRIFNYPFGVSDIILDQHDTLHILFSQYQKTYYGLYSLNNSNTISQKTNLTIIQNHACRMVQLLDVDVSGQQHIYYFMFQDPLTNRSVNYRIGNKTNPKYITQYRYINTNNENNYIVSQNYSLFDVTNQNKNPQNPSSGLFDNADSGTRGLAVVLKNESNEINEINTDTINRQFILVYVPFDFNAYITPSSSQNNTLINNVYVRYMDLNISTKKITISRRSGDFVALNKDNPNSVVSGINSEFPFGVVVQENKTYISYVGKPVGTLNLGYFSIDTRSDTNNNLLSKIKAGGNLHTFSAPIYIPFNYGFLQKKIDGTSRFDLRFIFTSCELSNTSRTLDLHNIYSVSFDDIPSKIEFGFVALTNDDFNVSNKVRASELLALVDNSNNVVDSANLNTVYEIDSLDYVRLYVYAKLHSTPSPPYFSPILKNITINEILLPSSESTISSKQLVYVYNHESNIANVVFGVEDETPPGTSIDWSINGQSITRNEILSNKRVSFNEPTTIINIVGNFNYPSVNASNPDNLPKVKKISLTVGSTYVISKEDAILQQSLKSSILQARNSNIVAYRTASSFVDGFVNGNRLNLSGSGLLLDSKSVQVNAGNTNPRVLKTTPIRANLPFKEFTLITNVPDSQLETSIKYYLSLNGGSTFLPNELQPNGKTLISSSGNVDLVVKAEWQSGTPNTVKLDGWAFSWN